MDLTNRQTTPTTNTTYCTRVWAWN